MSRANIIVNIVVVFTCIVTVADVGRNLLASRSLPSGLSRGPQPGSAFVIPGDRPLGEAKRLVLALSRNCRFCNASAPFYRDLIRAAQSEGIAVTVVTQDTEPGKTKDHLADLGVPITDVRAADFPALGVTSTPTLVLVGQEGRILHSWTGQLRPGAEREVIAAVSGGQ